jgi:hypothetical protein
MVFGEPAIACDRDFAGVLAVLIIQYSYCYCGLVNTTLLMATLLVLLPLLLPCSFLLMVTNCEFEYITLLWKSNVNLKFLYGVI